MYERAKDLHWGLMTLHQGVWADKVVRTGCSRGCLGCEAANGRMH